MHPKSLVFKKNFTLLILISIMFLILMGSCRPLSEQAGKLLKKQMIATTPPSFYRIGEERIHASKAVSHFYEKRSYKLAWGDEKGIIPEARELINTIHLAGLEGLNPEDYHLEAIEKTIARFKDQWMKNNKRDPSLLADLDILLTDAFMIYGSHLSFGRVHPETFDPIRGSHRLNTDFAEVLQKALHTHSVQKTLQGLSPSHPGYKSLKGALVQYLMIIKQGGWPKLSPDEVLKKGDHHRCVMSLRAILSATGDLRWQKNESVLFDDQLEKALVRFQERHGLELTGMMDPATLRALTIPPEERLRQIRLNMERWRWLPRNLGRRYILINIANFDLHVIEDDRRVMAMRVIVGKSDRQTPVFTENMTYIVLNPKWHVPKDVAIQDILPNIRKNISYLADHQFKVFHDVNGRPKVIDPTLIDWSRVDEKDFPYQLLQESGPMNPLGRIKFMFPNKYSVYLHDTPSKELFEKAERSFSAGCIRIEKPMELAEYVLRGHPKWTKEKILESLGKKTETHVWLREEIPVHMLYWTAWVTVDNTLHFRDDIYGRDEMLDEALKNCL